jgi:hypothetical protein
MKRKVPELLANNICRKGVAAGVRMKFSEERCRSLTRLVVTTMIPAASFSGDASSCVLHHPLDSPGSSDECLVFSTSTLKKPLKV